MGESANAVPRYQKLRTRVTHIWGNRRGQQHRSAMVSLALGEPPSWSRCPLYQVSMLVFGSAGHRLRLTEHVHQRQPSNSNINLGKIHTVSLRFGVLKDKTRITDKYRRLHKLKHVPHFVTCCAQLRQLEGYLIWNCKGQPCYEPC